jgi:diketogulonate reductase-like aldo/keto reductase
MTIMPLLNAFLILALIVVCSSSARAQVHEVQLTTTLSNHNEFPLVGLGVGNLEHDLINDQIFKGLEKHRNYRLVDTAHASKNEHLVRDAIKSGSLLISKDEIVHVVTKIWYTHLGYERTMIAVKESMRNLDNPNIRVTILIHWPYCRDDIVWMDCEKEEDELSQAVKDAGQAPHLDKDNAYKESWRALEDIVLGKASLGDVGKAKLENIGLSNFEDKELSELLQIARIKPHILQDNVWNYIFDPFLMQLVHDHNIHFQVYNVMAGILEADQQNASPRAYQQLKILANKLTQQNNDAGLQTEVIHPSQVVMAWLAQNDVSVVARTSNLYHLTMNSPAAIAKVPKLTTRQNEQIKAAVAALLRREQDLKQPKVNFRNKHTEDVHFYWKDIDNRGKESPVSGHIKPGEEWETDTYFGHVFVAYNGDKSKRKEFTIGALFGEQDGFEIEL